MKFIITFIYKSVFDREILNECLINHLPIKILTYQNNIKSIVSD